MQPSKNGSPPRERRRMERRPTRVDVTVHKAPEAPVTFQINNFCNGGALLMAAGHFLMAFETALLPALGCLLLLSRSSLVPYKMPKLPEG